jgi:hypothetical protein
MMTKKPMGSKMSMKKYGDSPMGMKAGKAGAKKAAPKGKGKMPAFLMGKKGM